MEFLPDAFAALNAVRQFIIYKIVPSTTRPGKTDKFPLHYATGQMINAHDPAGWTDFDTASNTVKELGVNHGVGFVFTEQDPYWFLDIDDCTVAGGWSELALQLCSTFAGAAIEISSSGKGLHIFGTGTVPEHSCKWGNPTQLEFYNAGRFVALTGTGAMGNIATDCSLQVAWLVDNYFPAKVSKTDLSDWNDAPCADWAGPTDDQVLIERMLRSQSAKAAFGGGASFQDLWENNQDVLAAVYANDDSSADAALAQHLAFWTGNDHARMLRLMRQSALYRAKWDRVDYLPRTIRSACAKQTEFLHDKPFQPVALESTVVSSQPVAVTGRTFLDFANQIQLFNGCTYVRDQHKILIPGGDLLKPDQFRAVYGGYSFMMDDKNQRVSRSSWECFTESQVVRFPQAHSCCFKPDLAPGQLVKQDGRILANLWWPVETPRMVGDVAPFLKHLKKVLPDERDQLILLSYMAACIQHKGFKFQWAPLIQGVEGNGKTFFSRCVGFAIGDKYTHYPKAAEMTAKFNDWMYGKVFIGVEDIFVPDSQREMLEALKPMITRERQEIEPKGGAKVSLDICCNFILNSNHKDGIRKTRNMRIIAPLYTAQQNEEDLKRDGMAGDYFYNLYKWATKKNGYAMISEFLHTFAIPDEFNPATKCQRAPITTSTEDAITHGLGGIEQEILEAVEQGKPGFRDGFISSIALDHLLKDLHAGGRIPRNKRRPILQALGYDLHPHLNDGRVNNPIVPDGGKPRLFVKKGHAILQETNAVNIAAAYMDAQAFRE